MSHQALLRKWKLLFEQHQVTDPWHSVKWLSEHIHPNALSPNFTFSERESSHFESLCHRRLNHEPIQYILGQWSFCGIPDFKIRAPTLIFRPETEHFVDIVTAHYHHQRQSRLRFMDIGCGSGVITASLLHRFPNATAIAMDCQQHAIDLTEINCQHIGVLDRVEMVHSKIEDFNECNHFGGDSIDGVIGDLDFIISNPPYVCSHEMTSLSLDIRRYEDEVALDGGIDGMDVIRCILGKCSPFLKMKGLLWIEGHHSHCALFRESDEWRNHNDFILMETYNDYCNIERFACFQKK